MNEEHQKLKMSNLEQYIALIQRNKGRLDYEDCLLMGMSLATMNKQEKEASDVRYTQLDSIFPRSWRDSSKKRSK